MLEFRISSTPNPNARKYILGEEIKSEGKITYRAKEDCEHIPLVYSLMSNKNIKQVHLFENIDNLEFLTFFILIIFTINSDIVSFYYIGYASYF